MCFGARATIAPKFCAMASPLHTLQQPPPQQPLTPPLFSNYYQHYSQISFLTNEIKHKENSSPWFFSLHSWCRWFGWQENFVERFDRKSLKMGGLHCSERDFGERNDFQERFDRKLSTMVRWEERLRLVWLGYFGPKV